MNIIFQKLWEEYKKANVARKLRILQKYGFTTQQQLEAMLEVTITTPKKATPKKVAATKKATAPKKTAGKKKTTGGGEAPLDMVVAFDTTGSMRSYIGAVRNEVVDTINRMFDATPNLRMKIVAFGDWCDGAKTRYQYTELTDDRQALINFVKNARDTSGGDGDEFYEYVIQQVLDGTAWREDSQKSFLLIGDANPHEVGYSYMKEIENSQIDWKVEAKRAAKLGVQIDTLRIHQNVSWYKTLSDMTKGVCMDFQTASKTSHIVEGLALVRGSKEAYRAKAAVVADSGDEELIGAYKTMNSLL